MSIQYRPEIDSLRAVAVLIVIFFHAGLEFFKGGYVGVDVFFVISGYLISSLIISKKSIYSFNLSNFFEGRIRRLVPALFFVIIITVPFSWFLLTPSELKNFGQSIINSSLFTSNILFWRESGYFASESEFKPLLHTWSLSIEVQFYILFSLFLLFILKLKKKWIVTLSIFIFGISLSIALWGAINKPDANFYLLPSRGWEFLLGFYIAYFNLDKKSDNHFLLNNILCLIGLSMIIFPTVSYDSNTPFPSLYSLIPTIGTALLIIYLKPSTFLFKIFNFKPLVLMGLISYSAYLIHFPILAFMKILYGPELVAVSALIILFITILLSYFAWKYIEKPFRDKKVIDLKLLSQILLTFFIILLSIGTYFTLSNGGMHLYESKEKTILKNFIDPSKYVISRFSKIELRNFQETKKEKILLIGDSFGEDLVNAFYESKADNQYISTYYIISRCGVLMIDSDKLANFQANDCNNKRNFYSSSKLTELMKEADKIWITSNWEDWTVNFIEESINNLIKMNDNIIIFGPKYFGPVSERNLISNGFKIINNHEIEFKNFENHLLKIEESISKTPASFINIQKILCEDKIICNPFDKTNLISYDGKHLTEYGAKKLGNFLYDLGHFK